MPKAVFAAALAVGLVDAATHFVCRRAAEDNCVRQECQNETRSRAPGSSPRASGRKNVPPSGKEAKAANKVEMGATWPKFWSDCNKRLKSDSK